MSLRRSGGEITCKGCLRPPDGGYFSPKTLVVSSMVGGPDGPETIEVAAETVGHQKRWYLPAQFAELAIVQAWFKGWEELSKTLLPRDGRVTNIELLLRSRGADGRTVLHCSKDGKGMLDAPYIEVPASDAYPNLYEYVETLTGPGLDIGTIREKAVIHLKTSPSGMQVAVVDLRLDHDVATTSLYTKCPVDELASNPCSYYLKQAIGRYLK